MSGNGFLADRAGLDGVVAVLRTGADDVGAAATPAPEAPDAGRSSENVGTALAAIAHAGALLIARGADTANKIDRDSGAYGHTDNEVATGLHGVEGQLLGPN